VSAMFKSWIALGVFAAALASAGCGELSTQGRSPVQLEIMALEAASGATPDEFGASLHSDVITNVDRTVNGEQVTVATIFNDNGAVQFALVMKDQGSPAAPAPLNAVTITRYRVVYHRTDGHNIQGVDVPFAFDSAVTVTVGSEGASTGFQLVRTSAKQEAPLRALVNNPDIISTIADVTFYGHDQAGNDISATGSIGVDFGNFGDPQ
jgi:hypothetical protein